MSSKCLEAAQQNAAGVPTVNVFRIVRPSGQVRWLRGRAFPVRDASGVVRRVVGVTSDITDLRETEQRFLQAQKLEAVGRLASGVAHDFNNLLTVIIAGADEPSKRLHRGEDLESVTDIRHAAESAATLTQQLLAFSRRQVAEPRVFDLNVAVAEASKMLRRLIGEDVHLEVDLAAEPLGVFADRGQIEQLILVSAAQPSIKTLFVAGYTDDLILKDRMLAGDRAILAKPFTADALSHRVRDLLDGRA